MMAKTDTQPKAENGKLARWDPVEMFESLQDELERIWGRGWPWGAVRPLRKLAPTSSTWMPRLDVFEKDGNLVVKAELPGVKKDDLEISLQGADLVIKGERKSESEIKEEDYYRLERSFGSFYRRLPLPFEAPAETIRATFTDGVLEIVMPKPAQAPAEAKQIKVN